MTEEEWLAQESAARMIQPVRQRASARKWRLFCCAVGRLFWDRLPEQVCRTALGAAEQFADG